MLRIFIDGQAGTTGLKIHERLNRRMDVEVLEIMPGKRKDAAARKAMLNEADVAILCLPDDAAREAVAMVENPALRIIDTSTAHRTQPGWAYGLPELSREHRGDIARGKRIAVPGCHATGFITAIYPLVVGGLLPTDALITCHSITGYSGGGNKMIAEYQDAERPAAYESPRQYGLGLAHKHLPEMTYVSGLMQPPVFNPIVCDFYAGMAVSIPLHMAMLKKKMTHGALYAYLDAYYAEAAFITVHKAPGDGFLPANKVVGTNKLELYICGNDEQITLVSVLDNLGKGASGAAMQCMNIAMGLPEEMGF